MRAVLVLLLLVAGGAFFLTSQEETGAREPDPANVRVSRGRLQRDEAIENPMLATEIEADADGHVTVFFGDQVEDPSRGGIHVAGRVVDPRGEPVQGLALGYRSNAELGAEPDTEEVRCDGRGEFTLVARSTYAEFACEDSRWALLFAGVEENGGAGFRITLIAAPTTPCAGVVTDRAGHRIEGARVQVSGRVEVPRAKNLTSHEFSRRIETDERGHFDFGRVPLLSPTSLVALTPDLGSAELELVAAEERELSLVLQGTR
ncbi:MAG: hypothetical protein L6Q99_00515 [Planctomycetes bacterium]|nr:hypothetical protein [Planctomycetota bacterium]